MGELRKLTVPELRVELARRGLPKTGLKDELLARLATATEVDGPDNKKGSFGAQFQTMMASYPLTVNGLIAAALNAAGTVTSQVIQGNLGSNWGIVGIFALIGAFVITPLVLLVLVGRIFRMKLNKFQLLLATTVFGSLVVGAAFEASLKFLLALFDANNDMCLKPLVNDILDAIFSKNFLISAFQSRLVFFPADVLNIFFVPPSYAPIVGNVAGYLWTVVLALKATN